MHLPTAPLSSSSQPSWIMVSTKPRLQYLCAHPLHLLMAPLTILLGQGCTVEVTCRSSQISTQLNSAQPEPSTWTFDEDHEPVIFAPVGLIFPGSICTHRSSQLDMIHLSLSACQDVILSFLLNLICTVSGLNAIYLYLRSCLGLFLGLVPNRSASPNPSTFHPPPLPYLVDSPRSHHSSGSPVIVVCLVGLVCTVSTEVGPNTLNGCRQDGHL